MSDNNTANSQPIPAQPKNYLAESILVTLFCNIPCGIVGIVKAESVGSLYSQGHYQDAQDASLSAKKWCKWGFIIALMMYILTIALFIMAFIAEGIPFEDFVEELIDC